MATKAPIYKSIIRNGEGDRDIFTAAPSAADVKNMNSANLSPHQKEIEVSRVGWAIVTAEPTQELDGVNFTAELNGKKYKFGPDHPCHPYLTRQFPQQTKETEEYLKNEIWPDPPSSEDA